MTPLRTLASLWLSLALVLGALRARTARLPRNGQAPGLWAPTTHLSQRIDVQVITWGEDCGPRPQSQVLQPLGPVQVKEDGAHLVLRFSDRTLRTNSCWSPNPAVS
jgi:hypothetical protein